MGQGENYRCGAFWRAHFMEVRSVESVFVVEAILQGCSTPARAFCGVHESLDGVVDYLDKLAAAAGAALEMTRLEECPGEGWPAEGWLVVCGPQRFIVTEEPLRK